MELEQTDPATVAAQDQARAYWTDPTVWGTPDAEDFDVIIRNGWNNA